MKLFALLVILWLLLALTAPVQAGGYPRGRCALTMDGAWVCAQPADVAQRLAPRCRLDPATHATMWRCVTPNPITDVPVGCTWDAAFKVWRCDKWSAP